ncbi:MAG: periplasmic heavy metal sensor [Pseudomonadota bacterium]
MFGFLFGTACLLGLTATIARSRHEGHHCAGEHRGRGFRSRRARFVLHRLLDRLDTTPGQEKVIREAVDTLLEDVHEARGELYATRADVAQAIRSETLDRGAISTEFSNATIRSSNAYVRTRSIPSARCMRRWDERQRKILAELIEAGPFARGFGPFR